jgi:hypothetical protein
VTAEDETATKTYTIEVYRANGVPKTGQTSQYDGENDDGYLEEGVSWPTPRFTDNGDGTLTDNLTGLMWDQDGNQFGARTWAQAFDDIAGHTAGNYNDWRVPNEYERESLLNLGSTTYASDTTKAVMVRFDQTTLYGEYPKLATNGSQFGRSVA